MKTISDIYSVELVVKRFLRLEIDMATLVQILDEVACISHSANISMTVTVPTALTLAIDRF